MFTHAQILKVRGTWIIASRNPEQFGLEFYNTLFSISPEMKSLFGKNLAQLPFKFTSMLSYMVVRLDKLEELRNEMEQLASVHNAHHVLPEHYAIVKEALLATLKKRVGEKFDDETRDAWKAALEVISESMIEAQVKT